MLWIRRLTRYERVFSLRTGRKRTEGENGKRIARRFPDTISAESWTKTPVAQLELVTSL
jgi:hypothetical protein